MATLAFLGTGHIHTPNFMNKILESKNDSCKYVYDHLADRAAKDAEKLSAQVADIDTIITDAEVDGVIICSETDQHLDLVKRVCAESYVC